MRIRADLVFVSCILHTIALLYFVRAALWNYSAGTDKALLARLDAGLRAEAQTSHYLGLVCLVIIFVGLVTVWSGYIRRSRSAWAVMFVIVCLWAFPLFVLPFISALLHGRFELTLSEFLYSAISHPGHTRNALASILMFSAMLAGLLMPIKRFFGTGEGRESAQRPSARVVSFSLLGILFVLTALYVWVRIGVVYEIPVTQLNSTQRLPSPPPPPRPGD